MLSARPDAWWTACGLGILLGCTAGGGGAHTSLGGGGKGESHASGAGTGGDLNFVSSGSGTLDGGRPPRCDDAGHCTCINIASVGKPAHYGSGNDSTDAFQTWLNTNSSANLDLLTARTPLTPDLLAGYDVIILQALEDGEYGPFWQFSQAEVDALTTWVKQGGGLIALTGYGGDADEVDPQNQLLGFAGISYNKDDILGQCPSGEPCYCWANSVPVTSWQATSPISANIQQVGAFHGRSINSTSADLVVGAPGAQLGVSQQVGNGKVFVFCDEWVTYTSQWNGSGQQPGPNDPCNGKTADKVFQVPQFWYNVIKWVSPDAQCFDIDDPGVIK